MAAAEFKACVTCTATLDRDEVSSLSSSTSFIYPPSLTHLSPLGCISERLVAPIPRQLDDNYSLNVHLKRNLIHKTVYLQGCIKKATVKRRFNNVFNVNPGNQGSPIICLHCHNRGAT
jgi:hypothetical protein